MMRQFVKRCADGRVALVTTTGRDPIAASGETFIETTDDPIAPGIKASVLGGAVIRTPHASQASPRWTVRAETPRA